MEADGDSHMAAGEYEQAAVCFGLCLEQKGCDPCLLGTHGLRAQFCDIRSCSRKALSGLSLWRSGKRATAWMNLAKFSKAARDAEVFLAQCPNIGEAHLVMAQVRQKQSCGSVGTHPQTFARNECLCVPVGGQRCRDKRGSLVRGHAHGAELHVGRSMRYTDKTTVDQTRMPKTGSNGK